MILGGYLKVCHREDGERDGRTEKSLPERAWKMLPQNEEAIKHGGEIIRQVR